MPNARPTQPGYYWARYVSGSEWEPAHVVDYGSGLYVLCCGDDCNYHMDEYEWGPAIPEYRGEGGGE